jgi:hypothetical protein
MAPFLPAAAVRPPVDDVYTCTPFDVSANRSCVMTPEQQQIYNKIQDFSFDDGPAEFPFHARLARENGWSSGYTACVITEYRRFCFLAIESCHPVTPSDQVDQVWHLHLLYTKSYWQRFCQDTLGRSLHHCPTTGGEQEREKFHDWYDKTLSSYRRLFEAQPPPDIWPDSSLRFGEDIHYQRINNERCWIIQKPWRRRTYS